jgi:hypothetical protein
LHFVFGARRTGPLENQAQQKMRQRKQKCNKAKDGGSSYLSTPGNKTAKVQEKQEMVGVVVSTPHVG